MSIAKNTEWQNLTQTAARRPVLDSNMLKTSFSRSMQHGQHNQICVETTINTRLKKINCTTALMCTVYILQSCKHLFTGIVDS